MQHPGYPLYSVLVSLGIVLVGCAERPSSPFAGMSATRALALDAQLDATRDADLANDLHAAFHGGKPRKILALSGGGAAGAFGCGVLSGWRGAPGGRPTFDVVTGVSTGALMATFAFLGEPRDDDLLREVYTRVRYSDIFDGPLTFGPPNSVLDTGPLRRLIERYVTPEVIARVAEVHHQGRRLYVATVSLDRGRVVVWPLSGIAAGQGADRVERFRKVLLAAAAVPVLFPPVEIDGELHVDAGLEEGIFLRDRMLGPPSDARNAAMAPDRDATLADAGTVYAIVNGTLRQRPRAIGNNLGAIGARSLAVYTDALQLFNLRDVAHVALSHDRPFQFGYVALPDRFDAGPGLVEATFDPQLATQLYACGEAIGRAGPAAWHRGLPPVGGDANPMAANEPTTAGPVKMLAKGL